ncbi:unnamed protein product [Parnassius apollo]|uniref:(apollo) hypothetical protein n=1 Tax=Parnassius apollo TaxID=110799 RepID=A0A8S3XZN8_PARAO|nr:unnamed protein product [Parnassius apollo]
MFQDKLSVARCCFCAPLRYGLLIWAYLKLVTSILVFGVTVIWIFMWILLVNFEKALLVLLIATMLSLIVDIVFNFVLIIGSHKKNITMLSLYYRYGIAHAVVLVVFGVLWILYAISRMEPPIDSKNVPYIFAITSAFIVSLILHIYLFIVLRSEINKLKARDQFRFVNHAAESCNQTEDEFNTFNNKIQEDN